MLNSLDGWRRKSLGDCCKDKGSYGANAPAEPYRADFPRYIRITDINSDGSLRSDKLKSLNPANAKGNELLEGDIVFARSGATVGKTYLHDGSFIAAYAGYLIKFHTLHDMLLPEYLLQYTKGPLYKKWIAQSFRAGAQPNINAEEYSNLIIPVPPLKEQHGISEILQTWDEAIAAIQKAIDLRQHQYNGLRELLINWNSSYQQPIKNLVSNVSRKVLRPNKPYTALSIRSHGKGTYKRFVSDPDSVAMEHLYIAKANDLIVNITFAWEGAVALVPKEHDGGLVSHRFPTFAPIEGKVDSRFLRHALRMPRFTYLLSVVSPGGAGRNRVLNKTDFLNLTMPVPPLEEQNRISKILDDSNQK